MALKSNIYKFALNVADLGRGVYGDYPLTVSCHPSETESRMMLRVLAFALNAHEQLEFGRGISTDDEPDLWRKSLAGDIEQWIELGTPEPDRLKKASGRSDEVLLYCYGDRATPVWWDKHSDALSRLSRLRVIQVDDEAFNGLAHFAEPGLALQCTIDGETAWLSAGELSLEVKLHPLGA